MKASVPKLFFCPGSASYTPVSQGSRWRVASRQLRKPTTPSALAFFVVVRAPLGFPFGCAVQNPITPFTPTLPTRPPSTQNTDPQTLSHAAPPLANASRLPRSKAFQRRNKPKQTRRSRSLPAGKGISAAGKAARLRRARANQRHKWRSQPAGNHSQGALGICTARHYTGEGTDAGADQGHFSGGKRCGLRPGPPTNMSA